MNTEKLNDWLQVIGLFGVVASLIFVGLQMRQTDAIAISAIYQERAIAAREHTLINSSNPYFLSGTAKLYVGKEDELTAQEAIALEAEIYTQLVILDNYYQQYEWGYLPEYQWNNYVGGVRCNLEHRWLRDTASESTLRPELQAILESIIADAVENPSGCWEFEFPYPIVD